MSLREEIRERVDIVELISQYVDLKRSGSNFRGLCPFHKEKTPSFFVSPDKKIFHCFGCGKGGDVITFYMEYHGLSFMEAVREIAERYGIEFNFKSGTSGPSKDEREALYDTCYEALSFFKNYLFSESGKVALKYLKDRGFDLDVVRRWDIGFSPREGKRLSGYMAKKGLLKEAISIGLVSEADGEFFDVFRGRVIFPLKDQRGRVVGFAGRIIGEGDPKYINTKNSAIFNKSKVLFGFHEAIKHVKDAGSVFVVEGYFDLIRMHENGLQNSVATCGTSLTRDHILLLGRYAKAITAIFDGDDAGYKASYRALELSVESGIPFSAVFLPEGEDPDSFIRSKGVEAFEMVLDKAVSEIEIVKSELERRFDLKNVNDRSEAFKEAASFLSKVEDPVKRQEWARELSHFLGVNETMLLVPSSPGPSFPAHRGKAFSYPKEELMIVAGAMNSQGLREILSSSLPYFSSDELRALGYELLKEGDIAAFIEGIDNEELKNELLECLILYGDVESESVAKWCLRRLKERWLKEKLEELKKKASEAESMGDAEALKEIIAKTKSLKREVLEG